VICQACQTENKAAAKFCGTCGSPLSPGCPACGAEYEPGQRFCNECGSPLATPVPAAPQPVAAPEMRVVSVLFVDLVGYTSLSEARDAEDVRELLGRYFDTARTIVDRYAGTIEKFIGDAVMAVWGTPVAREDDAERAVRAGLELVDAVAAFGEEVGTPNLRARAGVVTGQVAALANPDEGLVVGDRVNTAARVQSAAEPGTVLVDETTRHATSAAIAYEDAGEHTVKGKAEPLRLWRAVRVVAGVAGSQRDEALEGPLVGRDPELRLIKELFHAAVDRRAARLVAISGAAGVGKTRLRWEFEKYSDGLADTVLWHSGRCLSYGEGVAYWALAEMVRQRLGIPEEAPSEEAERRLALGLERWVPDAADREFLTPRLGALLGTAEAALGRQELFAGWRLFFERLAEQEPVVLAFEDLQWADDGLLDFLEHLLDWSARKPIFILALARSDLAERRAGWPPARAGVTPIFLDPLDDDAVGELLDELVAGLPREARDRIVSQAEGIPLYALETVRSLADRGVLSEHAGRLAVAGDVGEIEVPATLSSLLTARLDGLAPDERALVKDLAVMGGSFPRSTVSALSGLPDERVDELLAALVRKQVLVVRADRLSPDRGQYAFAQTMLRTVAYDMLSRHERKPRHLAIAAHLRNAFPNDGEEIAEVIAAHYLDAYRAGQGDPDAEELRAQAFDALRRAARRAQAVGAPEAAERAYRSALELAGGEQERTALMESAAEAALQGARYEAALELVEGAVAAHEAAGREREAARLARLMGLALGRLGRNALAIERMQSALEVLGDEELDPDVAALNAELGLTLAFAGEPSAAVAPVESALRAAAALDVPGVLCDALTARGILCSYEGRLEEALVLLEGTINIARRHGLTRARMRGELNSGDACLRCGLPEAVSRSEAALALARQLGDPGYESVAAGNLMLAHLLHGRWTEVERLGRELLHGEGSQQGDRDFIHNRLATLHALRGETEEARAAVARMTDWRDSDTVEAFGLYTAVVALAEGRSPRALERLSEATRRTLATEGPSGEAFRAAWPQAVETAIALGRVDEVEALLELLDDQPRGHVGPYLAAQVRRGRGLLAHARGDLSAAEGELTAAIDGFTALSYPYWRAVAQTDLAACLVAEGRGDEAGPLLREATATLEGLGAAPALERTRDLVTASGSGPARSAAGHPARPRA
jgi:class 3 adenylate cyclase/tetratricopeptide (TPR) repeat protein